LDYVENVGKNILSNIFLIKLKKNTILTIILR